MSAQEPKPQAPRDLAAWLQKLQGLRTSSPSPDWPEAGDYATPEEHVEASRKVSEAYGREEYPRLWELVAALQEFLLLFPSHEHAERMHAEIYRNALRVLEAEEPLRSEARNWILAELARTDQPAAAASLIYRQQIYSIAHGPPGSLLDEMTPAPADKSQIAGAVGELLARFERRFPDAPEVVDLYRRGADSIAWVDRPATLRLLEHALTLTKDESEVARLQGTQFRMTATGKAARPMRFTAIDGREVDLAALQGQVVLIDFWATWCGPCVYAMPKLVEAYERWSGRGLAIIGISLDGSRDDLTDFVEEHKIPWPQHFDGKGWMNQFAVAYGICAIPGMYLIDREGRVAEVDPFDQEYSVEQSVAQLLGRSGA